MEDKNMNLWSSYDGKKFAAEYAEYAARTSADVNGRSLELGLDSSGSVETIGGLPIAGSMGYPDEDDVILMGDSSGSSEWKRLSSRTFEDQMLDSSGNRLLDESGDPLFDESSDTLWSELDGRKFMSSRSEMDIAGNRIDETYVKNSEIGYIAFENQISSADLSPDLIEAIYAPELRISTVSGEHYSDWRETGPAIEVLQSVGDGSATLSFDYMGGKPPVSIEVYDSGAVDDDSRVLTSYDLSDRELHYRKASDEWKYTSGKVESLWAGTSASKAESFGIHLDEDGYPFLQGCAERLGKWDGERFPTYFVGDYDTPVYFEYGMPTSGRKIPKIEYGSQQIDKIEITSAYQKIAGYDSQGNYFDVGRYAPVPPDGLKRYLVTDFDAQGFQTLQWKLDENDLPSYAGLPNRYLSTDSNSSLAWVAPAIPTIIDVPLKLQSGDVTIPADQTRTAGIKSVYLNPANLTLKDRMRVNFSLEIVDAEIDSDNFSFSWSLDLYKSSNSTWTTLFSGTAVVQNYAFRISLSKYSSVDLDLLGAGPGSYFQLNFAAPSDRSITWTPTEAFNGTSLPAPRLTLIGL